MKRMLGIFCWVLAAGLTATACDLCGAYCPCPSRVQPTGWMIGAFEQYTDFGTLQENGKRVANPTGQYMDSSVSQLLIGYQFHEWVGVQLVTPYIYRSYRRPDGYAIQTGQVSGFGDLTLLGNLRVYSRKEEDVTLLATIVGGIKFPTGNSSLLAEELNEVEVPGAPESAVHGHDLALGSGSYDGVVGTVLFGRWKRLFGTLNVQYATRSAGSYDYQYANDLTWRGGPGVFLWQNDTYSCGLQCIVSGEYKANDTLAGVSATDTAITSVYLGPQLTFQYHESLACECAGDLPVLQDNSALQVVPDYRVRAAVTWRF